MAHSIRKESAYLSKPGLESQQGDNLLAAWQIASSDFNVVGHM